MPKLSQLLPLSLLVLFFIIPTGLTAGEEIQKTEGVLGEAPFEIAWKAETPFPTRVVLYCHGFIPAEFPVESYLPASKEPYRTFIEEGWAVAASAYRRNGPIIQDAMLDTLKLLDHVEKTYGKPERVLLLGSSMGGAISLLLLEGNPQRFDGALILGRGLEFREEDEMLPFHHSPEDPILLLTNQTEEEAPRAYQQAVAPENPFRPALWVVQTDGHIHFTNGEYREAAYGILDWMHGHRRKPAPEKRFHIPPQIPETEVVFSEDETSAQSRVSDTNPTYGNIELQISRKDLSRLGLSQGETFFLRLGDQPDILEIPWVTTYNDVAVGEFLAFINEFGLLQVAINYEHLANKLGIAIGDQAHLFSRHPPEME